MLILQALYLMLPAYFANMSPVIFKKINLLNYPVDFGRKFHGKRVFGSHKTIRGVVFGTVVGILTAYLQFYLLMYSFFSDLSLVDYSNWLLIGFLLGFGALFGDIVESFFKRQSGVKPGKSLFPFDQLDFVVGALLFLSFIYIPNWQIVLIAVLLSPILHVLTNHVGYYLKIRNEKW